MCLTNRATFIPQRRQQVIEFHGQALGVTICEDAWNDENFWPNRRYDRDPVTELIEQGTQVFTQYFRFALHDRQTRFARGYVALDCRCTIKSPSCT